MVHNKKAWKHDQPILWIASFYISNAITSKSLYYALFSLIYLYIFLDFSVSIYYCNLFSNTLKIIFQWRYNTLFSYMELYYLIIQILFLKKTGNLLQARIISVNIQT
jgi:hypothetical protein